MSDWYRSHDDATLSYLENALHDFHTFKDVIKLWQAGQKTKANANLLTTDHLNQQQVNEKTNAET